MLIKAFVEFKIRLLKVKNFAYLVALLKVILHQATLVDASENRV